MSKAPVLLELFTDHDPAAVVPTGPFHFESFSLKLTGSQTGILEGFCMIHFAPKEAVGALLRPICHLVAPDEAFRLVSRMSGCVHCWKYPESSIREV